MSSVIRADGISGFHLCHLHPHRVAWAALTAPSPAAGKPGVQSQQAGPSFPLCSLAGASPFRVLDGF